MKRSETYATTGPRMAVRFFGSWDFTADDAQSRLPAGVGYVKGVPMGGDLRKAPAGKAPNFLVAALKDPYSGNLDRIQVVKGWLDKDGRTHENVYDVAWSGAPAGHGWQVAAGRQYRGRGEGNLEVRHRRSGTQHRLDGSGVRRPAVRLYYARVFEIPTPRWTAYEALRFGVKMPPEVPMTAQERAYTSPIWYNS
jgi:hypothetical protein